MPAEGRGDRAACTRETVSQDGGGTADCLPGTMAESRGFRAGMLDRAEAVLGQAKLAAGGAHLVARLTLTGATPLAWRLRRDEDLLLGELQNLAASLGECWIEAVELAVSVPQAAVEADAGPLTELERLMHEDVVASHAYRTELRETLSDLLRQLPKEARSLLAPDEASEEALLSELALQGADAVLARLGGESGRA